MCTLHDLNYFIANVPDVTCCIEAQDVIMAGLKKHWSADILAQCDKLPSSDYYCGIHEVNRIHIKSSDIWRQVLVEDDTSPTGFKATIDDQFEFKDIVSLIKNNLARYDFSSISIELYPEDGTNPQHSFVLVRIDDITYIVDAYGGYRQCEYRIFDMEAFQDLLRNPTLKKWNTLFHSRETNEKTYNSIWLQIDF